MNRRRFLQVIGASTTVGLAGCASGADGPHETPNEETHISYDYDPENYSINVVHMSRNAPDQVGVTARVISQQFAGETIPVEFWAVDGDGNVVFHQPVIGVGLDGGTASIATAWFDATEDEFTMDLYPKVRLRESPPE